MMFILAVVVVVIFLALMTAERSTALPRARRQGIAKGAGGEQGGLCGRDGRCVRSGWEQAAAGAPKGRGRGAMALFLEEADVTYANEGNKAILLRPHVKIF